MLGLVSAGVEYTETSDTICIEDYCTQTLYSGVKNVYEDEQWKDISQARSLKDNGFEIVILEDDKDYPIEVVDYNLTSITVKLNPKGLTVFNKDVPIRVWGRNETKELEAQNSILTGEAQLGDVPKYQETRDKVYEEELGFWLLNQEDQKTFEFGIGDVLEFGPNSTTITLQVADSENLEDTFIYEDAGATNYGSVAYNLAGGGPGFNFTSMIKFNISSIPLGAEIESSNLYLQVYGIFLDIPDILYLGVHHLYDSYDWVETDPTWNSQTTAYNSTEDTKSFTDTDPTGWYGFNTKEMLESQLAETNKDNLSIWLAAENETAIGNGNTVYWRSKEGATAGLRPILNITYFIDIDFPNVTNLISLPTSPVNYSQETIYNFNATVTDDGIITSVLLELNGTNFTATNMSTDIFNVSFTNLSAGTYNYIWSAIDGSGNINGTEQENYTIDKATSQTSLTFNLASPQVYATAITPTCGVTVGEGPVILKMDGATITSGAPLTIGVGTKSFNCSYASTENYTISENSSDYTITKATPTLGLTASTPITYGTATDFAGSGCPAELSCSLDIANTVYAAGTITGNYSTAGNANYTSAYNNFTVTINKAALSGTITGAATITFGDIANMTGNETNNNDSDVAYLLYRDNISVSNPDNTVLGAGTYYYIYNSTGGQNYTDNASLDTFTLTVDKAPAAVFAYVGNLRSDYTGDNVTAKNEVLNGTLINGTGNIYMYLNETLVNSGASPLFNITNLEVGDYYFNVSVLESGNYTYGEEVWNVNITVFYVSNLTGQFNLNENEGTKANDVSGDSINGTIVGAVWMNDGLMVTLTENVNYEVGETTGVFVTLSENIQWAQLEVDYTYFTYGDDSFEFTITNLLAGFMIIFALMIIFMFIKKMWIDIGGVSEDGLRVAV